ncbi:MAG TPA: 16S rRNA (guanine(527)-N(7))-methyltransferase RsmG [Ignavibacteria bacterium]|nr:16S rRNA (guanine(527)-N(7))-methyltransferase RsmG [Ignavibacteria bacterium]HRK00311.1 16S rRNA (guanine(527)-N(7))-methyltransferase RsmG [Ignavibacteria bacterium]
MEKLAKFLSEELHLNPEYYINEFKIYQEKLLTRNKFVNLVSRKTESIENHILNSIFFLSKYKLSEDSKIADIGTGGGFPGIPLKILYPESSVTLIDSISKKIKMLDEIIIEMNIKQLKAVCGRAEILSQEYEYKSKFDYVISKAVADLDKLFLWGIKFLNKNGVMICIKGGNINSEIQTLKSLNEKINIEVINFEFDPVYNIEDKKAVIIKSLFKK